MKNNLILKYLTFVKHKCYKTILCLVMYFDIFHAITFYCIKKKNQKTYSWLTKVFSCPQLIVSSLKTSLIDVQQIFNECPVI